MFVALAWILAKPFVMSVIIGAKNMVQLVQNIASTEMTLDAEDMARLDAFSALPSEYPGWMLERQTAGWRDGKCTRLYSCQSCASRMLSSSQKIKLYI